MDPFTDGARLAPRFAPVRRLGAGAMGEVWLAEDRTAGREVAVKVLPAGAPPDGDAAAALRAEFLAMRRLAHPRLVEAFEAGLLADGGPWYTMEVVPGPDLDPAAPGDAATVQRHLVEALEALAFLHDRGLVHADVKPENLRLGADGAVKLLDFGLVAPAGERHGEVRGTPRYLAPEAARGDRLDARSDLYGLGAVAYHLLAGRPPVGREVSDAHGRASAGGGQGRPEPVDDPVALLRAHLYEPPVHLDQLVPEAPEALRDVIMAMLAKSPLDRPADAREALAALGVALDGGAGLRPPGLVGRERELDLVLAALRGRVEGGAPLLEVFGAEGAGKSALLAEAQVRWQAGGGTALAASGDAPEGALAALRRGLARLAAVEAPEALAREGAALAGDLPDLDEAAAAAAMRAAWTRLVATLGAVRPLALFLDDWDRAEEPARALVADLLARPGLPLAAVATRAEAAQDQASAIELPGLDADELGELVGRALGTADRASAFVRGLHRATDGLPGLALGALADLVARGAMAREGDRWRLDRVDVGALRVDAGALAKAKLDALAPAARRLAEGLALLRRPASPARLAGWLGLAAEDAAAGADALRAARWLVDAPEGAWLRPGPAAAVRAGMDEAQAQALHGVLARGLVASAAGDAAAEVAHQAFGAGDAAAEVAHQAFVAGDAAAEVAHHAFAAGDAALAAPHAVAGARRLLAAQALTEAERLLGLALAVPDLAPALRGAALELTGDVARRRGTYAAAAEAYEATLAVRKDLPGAPTARAWVSLALTRHMQGQRAEASPAAEAGVAAAQAEGAPAEAARGWTTIARLRQLAGDRPGAGAAAEAGLAAARVAGDRAREAEAMGLLGFLGLEDPAARAQAIQWLEKSLAVRGELGDPVGMADALMLLGNAQMALGRWGEARACFLRNAALCEEFGAAPDDMATARINLGHAATETGAFTEAAAALGAVVADAGASAFLVAFARAMRAIARARMGQVADAVADGRAALAAALAQDNPYLEMAARLGGATAQLAAGGAGRAVGDAERGLAIAERTGVSEFAAGLAAVAGEALLALGEAAEAEAPLGRLRALAAEKGDPGAVALAGVLAARLALAGEQVADAPPELAAAQAAAQAGGMAPLATELGLLAGMIEGRAGRVPAGTARLRQALDAATTLGMPLLALEAAEALAAHAGEPDTLTRRDAARAAVEVAAASLPAPMRGPFEARWLGRSARGELLPADLAALPLGEALRRLARPDAAAGGGPDVAATIADFGHMVMGTLRHEEVQERIIDQVMALSGAERGMIMLVAPGGHLTGVVARPRQLVEGEGLMDFSRSFVRTALEQRRSVWVADARTDDRFAAAASVLALELRTVVCVPLFAGEEAVGVLYLDQRSVNRTFREADLRLVEGLAGFAGMAIANARRYEEARERAAIAQAVEALCRDAAKAEPAARAAIVLEALMGVSGAAVGALFTGDPPTLAAEAGADGGGAGGEGGPRPDADLVIRAARAGQPMLADVTRDGVRAGALALPLVAGRRVRGVAWLERPPGGRAFVPSDLGPLGAIAAQAAFVLDATAEREAQARRIGELERALRLIEDRADEGNRDPLTGAFSPAYMTARLADEIGAARRYGRPLALVALDVAGMGALNEAYGRDMGDAMLQTVAREVAMLGRQCDLVARAGDDAFVVLLPETPAEGAATFAARVRQRLGEVNLADDDGHPVWQLAVATAAVAWREGVGAEAALAEVLGALGAAGAS